MVKRQAEPLILANWGRRFIAWMIDYIIINVMLAYVGLEDLETKLLPPFLMPRIFDMSIWSPISILVFFLYWTFSEWYFGRSIGQLLLNLRLTNLEGKNASLPASAIQSIGKSLLLPLDCLIGWVYRPCRKARQRFFNKLSNTIVIYLGKPQRTVNQGDYTKEA